MLLLKFEISTATGTGTIDMNADDINRPIDPQVRIGHVHLKVADLERSLRFYCGVLGFELTQRYGTQAAFISAGGYHHHIGLNTWESLGGSPPPPGSTGLFHTAILYPTRQALADALRRLIGAGIKLDGASDHGVSEALYLRDPDENGVELSNSSPTDATCSQLLNDAIHENSGISTRISCDPYSQNNPNTAVFRTVTRTTSPTSSAAMPITPRGGLESCAILAVSTRRDRCRPKAGRRHWGAAS
jgi:catechol 2,3-dioxygenase